MNDGRWTKRPSRANQQSKANRKSEAADAVAAFLARGGAVKQMPAVVATMMACPTCGYTGIVGMAPGKSARCPKCRTLLPSEPRQ